jgi:hypothetical protein
MEPAIDDFDRFRAALDGLPDGYTEGRFRRRLWGATVRRSADGKRIWLYAEELGGTAIVSFNLYRLSAAGAILKPCEMASADVIDFVLGFEPAARDREGAISRNAEAAEERAAKKAS